MNTKARIIATLILTIGWAVALPRVPWLAAHALVSTLVLVILCGLWALVQRAWADVAIAGVIAVGFAGGSLGLPSTNELLVVLVTAAILAFGFLSLTLLIGPWSWFFRRRFLRLLKHRRHVGVTSLLLAFLHVNIVLAAYYNNQVPLALLVSANVFGSTALYLMELLGLTSWDWAQRKISLRWWNVIHTAALLPYLGIMAIGWRASDLTLAGKTTLVAIAVYWIILAPWRIQLTARRTANGWKQLHRLIYAAYAAVVIHIWTGVASQRPPAVQAIFWAPVALVVASHAVGLTLKIKARRVRPQPAASPTPHPWRE